MEILKQQKSLTDNLTLMRSLLWIKNKQGQKVRFQPNKAQMFYQAHKSRRNLILKARQKGLTAFIDADQLLDCIKRPTNAVVISHEKEATRRLFRRVKYYLDNMERKPVMDIDNKSEIGFPKRGSYYYIGTAGQKAFGRGDTIDRAHLSEAAYYDNLAVILNGISEAAEYGQIDIETTANGSGDFKDLWEEAKRGGNSYNPIFIPWFIDDEYSADNLPMKIILGLSTRMQEMFAIPDEKFELSPEERELRQMVKKNWGIDLTIGQIKWRRYKMADRGDFFLQEYPEDDVSCFLQSGRPVFREITLRETLRTGLQKGVRYYAGIDGAEGISGGDNHCFAVIDARRITADPEKGIEEVVPHVALEIASNEPIEIFEQRVAKICQEYDIVLGVEKQGVGVAHIQKLRALDVAVQEWNTTGANRPVMITDLEEAYRNEELFETYPEAKAEAQNMQYDDQNRADHPTGKHDDRIFARAIAWQMRKMPMPRITRV
jgi:hypothetical protein